MNVSTRSSARRSVVAILGAALAASVGVSSTVAHAPDPVLGGSLFGQDQRLEFDWRPDAVPPPDLRTPIRSAAGDVGESRRSRAATFAAVAGASNLIGYGVGTCGPNGIACFTRNAPHGFTMWFREQGHRFDWGSLKWCQTYDVAPNGCFDVETIALDEFGHVEILGHHANYDDDRDFKDAVVQTVSRAKPEGGWNMHAFGRCDIATLQREYDVHSSATAYSTCLALDTVLTLAASPTSIPGGGMTTLSATLKVVDLAAYDRLGGNPVTGRDVIVQRRTPGTTTWATAGTMTVQPTGAYTFSIRLQAPTEFRGVFKTPTDEGLRGDTSATVRVSVGGCSIPPCPLRAEPRS